MRALHTSLSDRSKRSLHKEKASHTARRAPGICVPNTIEMNNTDKICKWELSGNEARSDSSAFANFTSLTLKDGILVCMRVDLRQNSCADKPAR